MILSVSRARQRVGLAVFLLISSSLRMASAQLDTDPAEGLRDNTPRVHALTGARVVVSPGVELESATIVLRDGLVDAVGPDIEVPADARIWDLEGRIVYPGFIDAMSELGLPPGLRSPRPPGPDDGPPPQPPSQPADGFWNSRIRPETDVSALLDLDEDAVESLRSIGLTTVLSVPRRGIMRGQSAALNLSDPDGPREMLLASRIAQHVGAETSGPDDAYPSSLMGVIALIRQALYDAEWYDAMNAYYDANPDVERAATNAALEALAPVIAGSQRVIYATDDELDYVRALGIAAEFDLEIVLYGNGHEYRKTDLLSSIVHPVIVPVDFPDAPNVAAPDSALEVSLETLQHWELAPSSPASLAAAGISFALTADGIDDVGEDFWPNVRLAIERGLAAETALAALTTVPADLLELSDRLGTLETGKIANLVVADADLFSDDDAVIELVFVDGSPYEQAAFSAIDPAGRWNVSWSGGSGEWTIAERGPRLNVTIGDDDFQARLDGEQIIILPDASVFGRTGGFARMTGFVTENAIEGIGELPDGETFAWEATYLGAADEPDDDNGDAGDAAEVPTPNFRIYPAGAFGLTGPPDRPDPLLVQNATIWTSGPSGRLENADLLIRGGRIDEIGQDLPVPRDATVIDATGKHVTPGLIDAHSHTAISRGINEVGSAITVEVRVADVVNPTDISIYRQLAGGLTTANLMHGSANPMGGQTQTVKLRWGEDAEGLLFDGAEPGVKFALGENVKQSNWGEDYTTRYPQSRMGVDEIIRDTFDAARAYGAARADAGRNDPPVRRNLRLDAALEILDRDRAVHIHSYRQDEILAFIRLAEQYALDVAAFQHVLEGYKVGPEIAGIGAGGSTFSDWWGYKYEVIDAIPYNGALMDEAGVVVSFNSDDAELATRLNTEAAKAVRYGSVPEEEALGFVTINPAIQLGIDDRVGSLEPGKDGDFVIWSGDPLSTFSRAEQTWIEGRKYFDIDDDARMRAEAEAERRRLIQKILADSIGGDGGGDESSDDEGRSRITTDLYSSESYRSHAKGEGDE